MADKDSIRADEVRRFSDALDAMSRAYSGLADWLEQRKIEEIGGVGTPTAKRALGYLGGFSGSILKSLAKSLVDGESIPQKVASDLVNVEAQAKSAAKKRVLTTDEKRLVVATSNRLIEKGLAIAKPKKKRSP
jgi:hypothetical protein